MFSVGLDKLSFFILYSQQNCIILRSGFSTLVNIESNNNIKKILFGSLLGDGKLDKSPRSINARFGFTQGEKNKEYFLFFLNQLSTLCSLKYREQTYLDVRTGKKYKSLNFWTKSLPILTELNNIFYLNNIKKVPNDNELSLLSPIALAHWIMQDGSRGTSKGLYICTDSYTKKDVKRLLDYISKRYKISCSIHKFNGKYRIYILAKSVPTIRKIIIPYMHQSMLYKLGI